MTSIYEKRIKYLEAYRGTELSLEELQGIIMMHQGGQPQTISNALRVMGMTGLIKDIGNSRFKILK